MSSTFDAWSNGVLAGNGGTFDANTGNKPIESSRALKKPQLRIHTKIDDNFQI